MCTQEQRRQSFLPSFWNLDEEGRIEIVGRGMQFYPETNEESFLKMFEIRIFLGNFYRLLEAMGEQKRQRL